MKKNNNIVLLPCSQNKFLDSFIIVFDFTNNFFFLVFPFLQKYLGKKSSLGHFLSSSYLAKI